MENAVTSEQIVELSKMLAMYFEQVLAALGLGFGIVFGFILGRSFIR